MRALTVIVAVACVACASATAPSQVASSGAGAAAPAPAKPSASAPPLPTTLLPGVGMSSKKPPVEEDDDVSGPAVACAKDEDCWSKTCCPAKTPEECVHASRARKCAIVDIKCAATPIHYTCVCESGTCHGRLAPP
jgi:hypothetical protein